NTYTYDAMGQMITGPGKTITFNARNLPGSMTGTSNSQYWYDESRARIQKVYGTTTRYLGDDIEIALTGNTYTKYLPGGAKRVGATTYWLHTDSQGSIQSVTDATGVEQHHRKYYPYGDKLGSDTGTLAESRGYIGQRLDETGLIYLHARYYD